MATKKNGHAKASKSNGHIRAKIQKIYNRDKKKIAHVAKNAKDKFHDVEHNVEKYAKSHPWKTMGFSVLAGVIVAQIMHFRK